MYGSAALRPDRLLARLFRADPHGRAFAAPRTRPRIVPLTAALATCSLALTLAASPAAQAADADSSPTTSPTTSNPTTSNPSSTGSTSALPPQPATPFPAQTMAEARRLYYQNFAPAKQVVPFSSNTVYAQCQTGSANPLATTYALQAWNYFRSLTGMAPVSIPTGYGAIAPAQAAALAAAAGPGATNNPTVAAGYECATPAAQLGAASGLIARTKGLVSPGTEMLRYITEASTSNLNDSLGHRLQLLNPSLTNTAIGLASVGTAGPSASSVQTFDSRYTTAGSPLQPPMSAPGRPTPSTWAWPSGGWFPTDLLPTASGEDISRWSFSAACTDLRAATVTVTGPHGVLNTQVVHRDEPGVNQALTPWNFAGYDTLLIKVPARELTLPTFYDSTAYEVRISGLRPADSTCPTPPAEQVYQVRLFNPDWPTDPTADADGDGIANQDDSMPTIPNLNTTRLAGGTRVETAVAISRQAFPNGAAVAYLARADVAADALAGGALRDGPVLLTPPGSLAAPAAQEIARLGAKTVIILGGNKAVSDQVLSELTQASSTPLAVWRLAGHTREETSLLIARRAFGRADTLYLANSVGRDGQGSPDAVVAGSLPDGPIALIHPTRPVLTPVAQLARDLGVKRVVALGGTAVMPSPFITTVAGTLPATRLAGGDRYSTSRLVAAEVYRLRPTTHRIYLARGDVFADAIAGGVLSDGPILLVDRTRGLGSADLETMAYTQAFQITALGGPAAVSDPLLGQSLAWPSILRQTVDSE